MKINIVRYCMSITVILLFMSLCSCNKKTEDKHVSYPVFVNQTFDLSVASLSAAIKQAEKGDPDAARKLANYYLMVENDPQKGFYWNIKAAENGHTIAQFEIGRDYLTGNEPINNRDYNKAKYWLRKAAKQGDPEAIKYFKAILSDKEIEILSYKANCGDADAAYKLYNHYHYANKERVDEELYWLKKAAQNGNTEAQYFWGRELEISDKQQALKWISKAAKKGHIKAQDTLNQFQKAK